MFCSCVPLTLFFPLDTCILYFSTGGFSQERGSSTVAGWTICCARLSWWIYPNYSRILQSKCLKLTGPIYKQKKNNTEDHKKCHLPSPASFLFVPGKRHLQIVYLPGRRYKTKVEESVCYGRSPPCATKLTHLPVPIYHRRVCWGHY